MTHPCQHVHVHCAHILHTGKKSIPTWNKCCSNDMAQQWHSINAICFVLDNKNASNAWGFQLFFFSIYTLANVRISSKYICKCLSYIQNICAYNSICDTWMSNICEIYAIFTGYLSNVFIRLKLQAPRYNVQYWIELNSNYLMNFLFICCVIRIWLSEFDLIT